MALEIEINGNKLTVPDGSTIMDAAYQAGTYIPHFCYHKKLSIAANCRMCLVEVEKAPKPLPACATPVTDGMKVFTHSDLAVKAQKGVMEFLLINHPLDCPICDQGGECQLQDLAVGYGNDGSRYQEEKRVVPSKDMGPLISAEEMSRCIHCTRCVRFTEEIGGFQEIGMANRGEFSEILPFLGKTVNSEISGNVIDLCPVGALTSKPFRYSARTWELSRRRSVSPHDGLGSNLIVQVKHGKVYRVLPFENEAINECWLADRDRFSYEALNSSARLVRPMVRQDNKWIETDWAAALDYVAHGLKDIVARHGSEQVAFLATPHSTVEELFLFKKLAMTLGVKSTDTRTRRLDFSSDAAQRGALWLGQRIDDIADNYSVLLIGANIRKEQPLLAARLRQATKQNLHLDVINCADDDLLCEVSSKQIVSPAELLATVRAAVQVVRARAAQVERAEPKDAVEALADHLLADDASLIMLGNVAQYHPDFGALLAAVNELASVANNTRVGVLGEAANSVGAELLFRPDDGGENALAALTSPKAAYVLLNTELDFDCCQPVAARRAVKEAKMVVSMTAFKTPELLEYADVLLPIAPFTETSGTFINMEGRAQSFNGVVKPLGEARPAWKVLRVLGNLSGSTDFEFTASEQVRDAAISVDSEGFVAGLNNDLSEDYVAAQQSAMNISPSGLQWLSEVPIYQSDVLVRHADSLQQTQDAAPPVARLHPQTLAGFAIQAGERVKLEQEGCSIFVSVDADTAVPEGVVRLSAAHGATCGLGQMFGQVLLTREG